MKIPNDYMEMSYCMEIVENKDEGGMLLTLFGGGSEVISAGASTAVSVPAIVALIIWYEKNTR